MWKHRRDVSLGSIRVAPVRNPLNVIGNGRDRCGPMRGMELRLQEEFTGTGSHDDRTD